VTGRRFAFLRGLNVGGHRVTMDRLRALFEEVGFRGVESFIASGNIVFDAAGSDEAALEARIEPHLAAALGYGVDTSVRTPDEVAAILALRPFGDTLDESATLHVAFVKRTDDAELAAKLAGLRTPTDDFRVVGREAYWLCRTRMSESPVSVQVTKALARATLRNSSTLRRMLERWPPG
jgi:uncharacterized protein (DUF1697 family)